jgi:glycosyltransferase involved in cell wall biosynthesis
VPEVIEHGVNGFIVDDVDEAVRAVREIGAIDRARCRKAFEQLFSAERMARDYLAVYHDLLQSRASADAFIAAADTDALEA